jgi:hypothetical protein
MFPEYVRFHIGVIIQRKRVLHKLRILWSMLHQCASYCLLSHPLSSPLLIGHSVQTTPTIAPMDILWLTEHSGIKEDSRINRNVNHGLPLFCEEIVR